MASKNIFNDDYNENVNYYQIEENDSPFSFLNVSCSNGINFNNYDNYFFPIDKCIAYEQRFEKINDNTNLFLENKKTDFDDFPIPSNSDLPKYENENTQIIYPNTINRNNNDKMEEEEEKLSSFPSPNPTPIHTESISQTLNIELNQNQNQNQINTVTTNNPEKKKTTKISDDNIRRKVKHILLNCIIDFLNKIILILYNNKIGKSITIKQFKNLNQKAKSDTNVQYNKEFLNRTICDIFSEKISGRFTNYQADHNKKLIDILLNEKNNSISSTFHKLLSLTFFEYLEHFRGTKNFEELKGMTLLDEVLSQYSDEPDYLEYLEYYFKHYEECINKKRSRNSKKKKKFIQ